MHTRTAQTIINSTLLVNTFTIDGVDQTFEIRELKGKTPRKHYILLLANVCHDKQLWEDVKVVSEIQRRSQNNYYVLSIAKQYSELAVFEDQIKKKAIELIGLYNHDYNPSIAIE